MSDCQQQAIYVERFSATHLPTENAKTHSLVRSLYLNGQFLSTESADNLELLSFGYFQKLPEDLLRTILTKISAKDLASLESSCYIFRRPIHILPNRRASALEILAYKKCRAYNGVWNLSDEKWTALIRRCRARWKLVLHFIEAVERARGGKGGSGRPFSQVAAGCYETLAVAANGTLMSFGASYPLPAAPPNRLSTDGLTAVPVPPPLEVGASLLAGARVASVAVGQSHVVLLDEGGQVYTYGKDVFGCCGLGQGAVGTVIAAPQLVEFPRRVACQQVSAGLWHTVALTSDGQVYSWGGGANGRLGTGNLENQLSPAVVPRLIDGGRVVQVVAGASHTLALLATGVVYSFGCGVTFQLGNEGYMAGRPRQNVDGLEPEPIRSLQVARVHIVAIAAGEGNSAAIDSNGHVYTWGDNYCGSLGHGHESPVGEPAVVASLSRVRAVQVTMKKRKTLVLTDSGQIYACGWAAMGALGVDIAASKTADPCKVEIPTQRFVQIGAGWYHSVGITETGRLLGFGDNEQGQLGCNRVVEKPFECSELMEGLEM